MHFYVKALPRQRTGPSKCHLDRIMTLRCDTGRLCSLLLTVFTKKKKWTEGFKQSYIKVKSHFYDVFLCVLFLKKNMSIDINVTNAPNPDIATFLILGCWNRSRGGSRFWLFSFMDLSMMNKTAGIREGLGTPRTHEGLFSCVCSHMNHQMLRPRESLVTLGAGVFLLAHVSFYMAP